MNPFQNIWGKPKIGKNAKIAALVEIGSSERYPTVIGDDFKIEAFAFVPPGTTIGNRVFIGPHACITNDKHPKAIGDWILSGVTIGDDVSIGAGAVICPGVHIGEGVVVGAGAIVTKDLEAGHTFIGNPAHPLL